MISKAGVTLQENVLIKSVVFGLEIEVVVVTEVNAELNIHLGFSFYSMQLQLKCIYMYVAVDTGIKRALFWNFCNSLPSLPCLVHLFSVPSGFSLFLTMYLNCVV